MRNLILSLIILVTGFVTGCNESIGKTEKAAINENENSTIQRKKVVVNDTIVTEGTFNSELICNGKAFARQNAEIRFPLNEEIEKILISNGTYVKKGQVLAVLNAGQLRNKLNRSIEALEKAKVDLEDRLIDYGYRLKDSARIPAEVWRMAKVKSGYKNAIYDYTDSKEALKKTRVVAPFSGRVANLEAREFNTADNFKRFCTLVDDSEILVRFNVLESELSSISKGAVLEVHPFGSDSFAKGHVQSINPVIDESGMIEVRGSVMNSAGLFLNGMNLQVVIRKKVPHSLIVPKDAVLQRQDREVVFTYEDGRAKWNYVTTGLQNRKYVIVTSGLKAGDRVIFGNNFTLAHDTEVELDNEGAGSR